MKTRRNKITIVGSGFVGATAAHWSVLCEMGDVVLIDILPGIPQGKALDLWESTPVFGYDVTVSGSNDYATTKNSDVVVITAGVPRKPGMSRDDLLQTNTKIVKEVVEQIVRYSPECILIVVSNPLDAMTWVAQKTSRFPKQRVIGMAGILDTARYCTFISETLSVSVSDIKALVLGTHGDTMVPLPRLTTVGGIPLPELLSPQEIEKIVKRTQEGGAEIVNLLKTGSAYFAPGAAAVQMVEAILKDKKKILPCSAYLEGEYGFRDLFLGVPVKLGAVGVEKIYEISLTAEEKTQLKASAAAVSALTDRIQQLKLL